MFASVDIVGFVDHRVCVLGEAKGFDLPRFVVIDLETHGMRSTARQGRKRSVRQTRREYGDVDFILQGLKTDWECCIAIDKGIVHMAATT